MVYIKPHDDYCPVNVADSCTCLVRKYFLEQLCCCPALLPELSGSCSPSFAAVFGDEGSFADTVVLVLLLASMGSHRLSGRAQNECRSTTHNLYFLMVSNDSC